jgi:tellurite resistance protein
MARDLHDTAALCAAKLQLEIPLELYVFPSPTFNAACVKPEDGRLFIMFSSAILEAFSADEIRFVVGHELGHHLFHHHDIPIGFIMRGESGPDPRLALTLTSWSRYAEISADRAGAYCADDLTAVAHALFKLASGLSGNYATFSADDFLDQVDEMQLEEGQPGQGAPIDDWFLTHPFSPLRVKALQLFDASALMRPGGHSRDELELGVEGLLSLMEPSYLEGKTETAEAMRRLLFAAAITVADASSGISTREVEAFEKFFGAASFSNKLHVEKIKGEVEERCKAVTQLAAVPQRMQIIRDLCVISRADGHATDAERDVICAISKRLGVSALFVDKTLACPPELD